MHRHRVAERPLVGRVGNQQGLAALSRVGNAHGGRGNRQGPGGRADGIVDVIRVDVALVVAVHDFFAVGVAVAVEVLRVIPYP